MRIDYRLQRPLDSWAVVQENASNLLESATTDDCTVIWSQIIILHPKYKSTAVRVVQTEGVEDILSDLRKKNLSLSPLVASNF